MRIYTVILMEVCVSFCSSTPAGRRYQMLQNQVEQYQMELERSEGIRMEAKNKLEMQDRQLQELKMKVSWQCSFSIFHFIPLSLQLCRQSFIASLVFLMALPVFLSFLAPAPLSLHICNSIVHVFFYFSLE